MPLPTTGSSSPRAPAGLRAPPGCLAAASAAESLSAALSGSSIAAISERAGVAVGVGSNVTQPMPSNHASTHECASRSRTTHSPWRWR